MKDISNIPIGIRKKDLNICTYDFTKNLITIVTSRNIEDIIEFISHLLEELNYLKNINTIIFDAEKIIQSRTINLNSIFDKFKIELENNKIKSIRNNFLVIIIGIDKFLNELEITEEQFNQLLKNAMKLEKYNFIIAENSVRLKNHEYDIWYKNNITGDNGIWIGNGISDQYLIDVNSSNKDIENNCGRSFGYMVKQGQATLIKLLGMKESGEL